MDKCEHNWVYLKTVQYREEKSYLCPDKNWRGKERQRLRHLYDRFVRIDNFYCSKCLEDTEKIQRATVDPFEYPIFSLRWVEVLDVTYHFFSGDEHSRIFGGSHKIPDHALRAMGATINV